MRLRPKTTRNQRLFVAFPLWIAALYGIGTAAQATVGKSPLWWLLYILLCLFAFLGGRRVKLWSERGRNGELEVCPACPHKLIDHPKLGDYACTNCDCDELTLAGIAKRQEESDVLDAQLLEAKDDQEKIRLLAQSLDEFTKRHRHG